MTCFFGLREKKIKKIADFNPELISIPTFIMTGAWNSNMVQGATEHTS